MDMSQAFASKYLKAEDLQNREVTVTMDRVETEEFKESNRSVTKYILYFQNKQKGVVLNKTNFSNISSIYGKNSDGWVGKPVVLFSVWTDFQGKSVQAIRIRPVQSTNGAARAPAPKSQPQTTPPPDDDDYGARDDQEIPF
jgi:hypothetical protein